LFQQVLQLVAASITPATHDVSGTCAANRVVQASLSLSCADLSGTWRVTASETGAPPVDQIWNLYHTSPLGLTGTVPSQTCGTLYLAVTRATLTTPFTGSVVSCPEPITGPCPAQIQLPLVLTHTGRGIVSGELTSVDVDETPSACAVTNLDVQHFQLHRYP
jgi:hypothetical protein